eukprot:GHVU01007619.1.p1 GENE.GHVU01007619.1~~GHVU01007619.1.p1  ORF type:complete len:314 (-),score=37.02 GHVU01007619.1:560-1501(-)
MAPERHPRWRFFNDQGFCEKGNHHVSCKACDVVGKKMADEEDVPFVPVLFQSKREPMDRHIGICPNIARNAREAERKRKRECDGVLEADDHHEDESNPKRPPTDSAVGFMRLVNGGVATLPQSVAAAGSGRGSKGAGPGAAASARSSGSTAATFSVRSAGVKPPPPGAVLKFADRPLTAHEAMYFIDLCIEAVADNNLPGTIFERPSVVRLLSWLRPGCREFLPSGKVVLGPRLDKMAAKEVAGGVKRIQDGISQGAALAVKTDGWKAGNNDHMLGTRSVVAKQPCRSSKRWERTRETCVSGSRFMASRVRRK